MTLDYDDLLNSIMAELLTVQGGAGLYTHHKIVFV